MPYRAKAAQILEEWRAAERRLLDAPEPEERITIQIEIDRLRAAYHAVVLEARAANMPEPPEFPVPPRRTL